MALNQVLRRLTYIHHLRAAAYPLYITSIAFSRRALSPEIVRHESCAFQKFSTAVAEKERADRSLLSVIQVEIDAAEDEPKEIGEIPENFPFKIEEKLGERIITLTRMYEDEMIKVDVDVPTYEEEGDSNEDDEYSCAASSIPLVVSVTKGDQCIEFGVTAYPDEVTIDSLCVNASQHSEDQLPYEGPDFGDLDENLQKAFHKYLNIRGIKPSTTNFLFEYMQKKDNKEYYKWLHTLKNFIEK